MGTGNYIYIWYPSTGLNDSTLANPIANPTETTEYVVFVIDSTGCAGTDNVIVNVVAPFTDNGGSKDDTESFGGSKDDFYSFEVFPNPTQDMIHLSLKGSGTGTEQLAYIEILNSIGNKVYEAHPNFSHTMNRSIDLSSLAAGNYIVNVTLDQQRFTRKVTLIK
jgi:hypothetical protein